MYSVIIPHVKFIFINGELFIDNIQHITSMYYKYMINGKTISSIILILFLTIYKNT